MGFETPESKKYSPEEMANIHKERMQSEIELMDGGATPEFDEKGNRINLIATKDQKYSKDMDHFNQLPEHEQIAIHIQENYKGMLRAKEQVKAQNIEKGDLVEIKASNWNEPIEGVYDSISKGHDQLYNIKYYEETASNSFDEYIDVSKFEEIKLLEKAE